MRHRVGLLVGTAFLAGMVVAGPAGNLLVHGLVGEAQGQSNPVGNEANARQMLSLFGEVLERVRADYVEPVSTETLIYNSLNGMLSGLDPHSSYMDPQQWREMQVETQGDFGGLGMQVTEEDGLVKVISPIDDTPAAHAGIKPGDLITSIDGKAVEGLSLNDAVDHLRGAPGSKVSLTLKRQGVDAPVQLSLTREIIHVQVVKSRLYSDIGYVRLTEFNEEANDALRKAVAALRRQSGDKLRGIVLDLRNNPGGLLDQAVDVSSDFLRSGVVVSTRGRHDDDNHSWHANGSDITGGLPMVVLINEGTASAAEIVSGALQDNGRAAVLGTRSFGKGSVQTVIPLGNHGAMRLTTARYYTPDGQSIQGKGISPDVVVNEGDVPDVQFGPAHESDLNNTITNSGAGDVTARRNLALPAIVSQLAGSKPPKDWPKLDPDKPATDFQLHQALILVRAMAGQPNPTQARAD
jgi:carboxyl-terminal processing protease